MKTWLIQHGAAFRAALTRLAAAPVSSALNLFVLSASLFLPFSGFIAFDKLKPLSTGMAVRPEMSVFLAPETEREVARALEGSIRTIVRQADPDAHIAFVPRETALAALENRSGLSEALKTLPANPLPDAYVIRLSDLPAQSGIARSETLVKALEKLPGVDIVQQDGEWLRRLSALLQLGRQMVLLLTAAVAVVVVGVTFNTIRLQMLLQHDEIALARLVGATDSYIRRPFYYAGGLIGGTAGAVALAAVAVAMHSLNGAAVDLARSYGSNYVLSMPNGATAVLLILFATLLGLAGAALSVRQALAKIS